MRRGFTPCFVNYKKVCTRLAASSDKVCQLLPHGRWFSPGTPASSTTKTCGHDVAEILMKVALNTKNQLIFSFTYSIEDIIVKLFIYLYIACILSSCYFLLTPRYSWNIAVVGVKHQSIIFPFMNAITMQVIKFYQNAIVSIYLLESDRVHW